MYVQAGGERLEDSDKAGELFEGSSESRVEVQVPEVEVVAWPDTDSAGCWRTRRSTSGGVIMFASHCLKTHSHTQETVALSSGESQLHGISQAATMGIGIKSLFNDLGPEVEIQVNTGSSTARSISSRKRRRASSSRRSSRVMGPGESS